MTSKRIIEELIENEVRKQQIPITEFARTICCQRNNVYDILKHSKIDIIQLKQASGVLNRNFSKEPAEGVELVDDSRESEEEVMKQRAVSRFLNIVSSILRKLGKSSTIVFNKLDKPGYEDRPTPDFRLPDYFITFTIDETLRERISNCVALPIAPVLSDDGCMVEVCTNVAYRPVCVNVRLDYKTADEWHKFLAFAFGIYTRFRRK